MGLNGYGHGDVEARPKHKVACPAACVRSVSHARHPQTKQAGHQARPVFVGRAKNQSLDESRYSQWENPRLCRISANLFEKIFAPAICACEVLRLSLWLSGPSLPACRSEQGPVESLQ